MGSDVDNIGGDILSFSMESDTNLKLEQLLEGQVVFVIFREDMTFLKQVFLQWL